MATTPTDNTYDWSDQKKRQLACCDISDHSVQSMGRVICFLIQTVSIMDKLICFKPILLFSLHKQS